MRLFRHRYYRACNSVEFFHKRAGKFLIRNPLLPIEAFRIGAFREPSAFERPATIEGQRGCKLIKRRRDKILNLPVASHDGTERRSLDAPHAHDIGLIPSLSEQHRDVPGHSEADKPVRVKPCLSRFVLAPVFGVVLHGVEGFARRRWVHVVYAEPQCFSA
jgi:hypothetical protein